MKTFRCHCGNQLHFENTKCLVCGRSLGFLPDAATLSALEPAPDNRWRALQPNAPGNDYRMCDNYSREQVCNWMIPISEQQSFCRACRLNHIIPNLSMPQNRVHWNRIERAKRRLIYSLDQLGLPITDKISDPEHGLSFQFLEGPMADDEFVDDLGRQRQVITGHHSGVITINVAEADSSAREEMREKMDEQYRTLLGHFRHEIGHYYWDRLLRGSAWLEGFRALFGDELLDYAAAMQRHYESGPPRDWQQSHISPYATAHPWEDWAETWAHYLHMVDTLETAHDFGFVLQGRELRPVEAAMPTPGQQASGINTQPVQFDSLLSDWAHLTVALNELNRSMGLSDAYPFALSAIASDKLRFVHRVIVSVVSNP